MFKKIAILAVVFIAPALAQNADDPLGLNARLADVVDRIDSSVVLMEQDRFEAGLDLVRTAQEGWQRYLELHNYVAGREFSRSNRLDTLAAAVTEQFGPTLEGDFKANLPLLQDRTRAFRDKADLPILADFSGGTCKNCKIMKARLTAVAPDYTGRVRIVYVNVNEEKALVSRYHVILIPTLVFIDREGKESDRQVGVIEEKDLKKRLDSMSSR